MKNKKENESSPLDMVLDFHKTMRQSGVSFAYEGEVSHEITKAFSSLAESHIASGEDSNSLQRLVFHVMVESLQNVGKYSEERDEENSRLNKGQGILFVSKDENAYSISTGNIIRNENVASLTKDLETVNAETKPGLNKMFKTKIRSNKLSEKGGAGLGFIDIARKTGQKLIYSFLKLNEQKSYFVLTSTISRK